jgi:hypothetical protein
MTLGVDRVGLLLFLTIAFGSTLFCGSVQAQTADRNSQAPSASPIDARKPGAAPTGAAVLVTDPIYPESDLPPQGRSLFDYVVTRTHAGKPSYVVPYPFAELLRTLESEARSDPKSRALKAVLIPLGRSLQRASASPDFFAYPRAVVTVTAEPAASRNAFLKDRLYLGYQEKAGVLEVISYNEQAGRFEFQVVTDYRPGGTPRVTYANRALCLTCHQNAGPIFSRQVWDETNANPKIAALLAAERKDFYGIPVDQGIDIPNAIDDAVLRANRFAAYQRLWVAGCGDDDEAAVRCRAGLFAALIQFRLSGQQQFDAKASTYRDDAAATLIRVSEARWPGGLALGNPDIPNRNPLSSVALSPSLADREAAGLVHVATAFDPLEPRAPLETWRIDRVDAVPALVRGLAEFVAEPDIADLDRRLFDRAQRDGVPRRTLSGRCQVTPRAGASREERIEFRCTSQQGRSDAAVAAEGRLVFAGSSLAGGVLDRLELSDRVPLGDIDLAVEQKSMPDAKRRASLIPMRGALHARGADGNALERIELRWNENGEAVMTVTVREDFAPAQRAIAALVRDNLTGNFDGFSAQPFRRARLLPALLSGGLAQHDAWCCRDASLLPPAQAQRGDNRMASEAASAAARAAAGDASFYRYCGECHLGVERTPPNFLSGDAGAVEAQLAQCAPRIFVRLSMWRREPEARAKSPMPPAIALHRFNIAREAWRDGDALSDLLESTRRRLQAEGGSAIAPDALLRQDYETLRACLHDESTATLAERSPGEPTPRSR